MIVFKEDKRQYKWKEDIIDEAETMTFEELVDEIINVASYGDHQTNRDIWGLKFLKEHIIERHHKVLDKALDRWRKDKNGTK